MARELHKERLATTDQSGSRIYLFPEEVSAKKIGVRFLFLIAFIFGACIFDLLPLPEYSKMSLYKACMIMIGYLTISIGIMGFSQLSLKVQPRVLPQALSQPREL